MENMIYNSLVEILLQEDTQRIEKFKKAWSIYYGDHDKPMKVRPGKPDDNIRLNYARVIVDKGVSFLFGKELGFDVSGEADEPDEWLGGFWKQNKKMSLLQKLALNGGVCGHAFIKIKQEAGLRYPRLIVLDPETVSVRTATDDIDKVVRYLIQYVSTDASTQKPVAVRQTIEQKGSRWVITDQVADIQNMTWRFVGEEIWPWEWAPIVACQNLPAPNEYWGVSDLESDIVESNNAVNFVMSNLLRIIRFHAHPKTWGSGFSDKELRIGVDETIILPNPDATLQNLEMKSDLESSIELYKRLKEALHELSRVPEVATGKLDSAGGLSGVALEILYQPLIEKTETKRLMYGELIEEVCRRGLAMGGFGEEMETEITWQEMLPKDPMVERQAALIDKQLGVSNDTLQTKLGYDPETEKKKKADQVEELGTQLLGAFDRGGNTTEDEAE